MEKAATTVHTKPQKGGLLVNNSLGFSFTDENGKYCYRDAMSQYVNYAPPILRITHGVFSGENYSDTNQRFKDHSATRITGEKRR